MQTIFGPREARQFASLLQERASELRRVDAVVSRRLLELGTSDWRDERFLQFEKRYEEASIQLQQFARHCEKYADYLRRKAVPIERYLDRNY
jgi:hypothetical protein